MRAIEINPKNLRGEVVLPPSKSISHRAIIAAGLSPGESKLDGIMLSQDILATCEAMEAFGVQIDYGDLGQSIRRLVIQGNPNLKLHRGTIHCRESGSTLRFILPLAAMLDRPVTLEGEGRLLDRPLTPYAEIFQSQGITFKRKDHSLYIKGRLKPAAFSMDGNISSQFITGLLFALPMLKGDSLIRINSSLESKGYVDLTMDVLKDFSIQIEDDGYQRFYIKGNQIYGPRDYIVEGDYSQAAFWLAAGLLGGKVSCSGLNPNSLQGDRVVLEILQGMSGRVKIGQNKITAMASPTKACDIDASQCPDLVPILTVLAALSPGTTKIYNAGRLRLKESDRLRAMASELGKLGGRVTELEDGLVIQGVEHLQGGSVDSWKDHRVAMALAIASIKCKHPVTITNFEAVNKSYPGFWKDFTTLGGEIIERNMG